MLTVILVIHLMLAISLVAVVLLQRSEGGGLGMGGGQGGGLVSSRAAGNILTRTTAILAGGFMVTSLTLAIMANSSNDRPASVMDAAPAATTAPAAPTEQPAAPAQDGPAVPLAE